MKRIAALAALFLALSGLTAGLSAAPAHASTTQYFGARVLDQAETRAGDWYVYGGAGPSVFDCSGLVVWSAARLGRYVPHSTYSMLADSGHFYRIPVSAAIRGDLLFFGSGHVEIMTAWYHTTFGAHHSGTQVGWRTWNGYYAPTMALRWRG